MSLHVDADGIVSVSVKDEAAREDQSFVIEPPTGLTEDDIRRMIDGAEAHGQKEERFDTADNTGGSALEEFVGDLAPAVDAFEHAAHEVAGHAEAASGSARAAMVSMANGAAASLNLLQGVMERHGIDVDDPTGRLFNPSRYEAMMMVSDPNVAPGLVAEVFENGYTVNGRLVRPTKVSVAR